MDKEREDRLRVIAVEMDTLVREIGPKWIKLAHLRKEAQQIIADIESKMEVKDEGH